jgi:hypothetical protein
VAVPAEPPPPKPQLEGKVIGRVGNIELTDLDLARYQKFKEATVGIVSGPEALNELCERTVLNLAAADHQLSLSPAELELFVRRRVPLTQRPDARGTIRASSLEAGEQVFASRGLSPADVEAEVKADSLAQLAKQVLVYDKVPIGNSQLRAAYASRWRSRSQGAPNAGPVPSKRRPDKATVERFRQQLRRERGAGLLRALLDETKRKWKTDCGTT